MTGKHQAGTVCAAGRGGRQLGQVGSQWGWKVGLSSQHTAFGFLGPSAYSTLLTNRAVPKPAPCRCSWGRKGTRNVSELFEDHQYSSGSNHTLYFLDCQGEKRTTASMKRCDGKQEPTLARVEDVFLELLSPGESSHLSPEIHRLMVLQMSDLNS